MQFFIGFILASLIGYLAYRRQSLSVSGLLGAILTGTLIFGLGGLGWGLLLITFFISSSALSHYKASLKEALAEKFSKGGRRDLGQVLANGGAGALFVIGHWLWPHPLWWAAFAGALATVNADTWATELGVLNRGKPRLVTTLREVEVGTSGGVSPTGTAAALAGAALVGLVAAAFTLPGGGAAALDPAPTVQTLLAQLRTQAAAAEAAQVSATPAGQSPQATSATATDPAAVNTERIVMLRFSRRIHETHGLSAGIGEVSTTPALVRPRRITNAVARSTMAAAFFARNARNAALAT